MEEWCLSTDYTGLQHWHVIYSTCHCHRLEQVSSASHLSIIFSQNSSLISHTYERFYQEQECIQLPQFLCHEQKYGFQPQYKYTHKKSSSSLNDVVMWFISLSRNGLWWKFKVDHIPHKISIPSAMIIQVTGIWHVISYSLVDRYQPFWGKLSTEPQRITSKTNYDLSTVH